MYRRISDFVRDWDAESRSTLLLLRGLDNSALGDNVLDQRPREGARSVGEIAWHLSKSLASIGNRAGLAIDLPPDENAAQASSEWLSETYQRASANLREQVATWEDTALELEDDVYGERWQRGHTLRVLIAHEIHHRGQLTTLLRAAGVRLPPIYGPSGDQRS